MDRLRDKVAFITGGAGGIGAATAERFVAEGAKVVIADLFEDAAMKLASRIGPNAVGMKVDIGDETSFKSALDATVEKFGRLDILFNNAAATDAETQNRDSTVTDIPLDVWERTMHVNVTGYLYGCRHAIPHMLRQGGGNIINTASGSGQAGDSVRVAYGTSKAAVIALTLYVATQYGKQGIRCNGIAPGPVVTEHSRKLAGPLFDMIKRHALTKELGVPEDVAALVTFLAADESRYIAGQIINIDGGLSSHHPHVVDFNDFMAAHKPA